MRGLFTRPIANGNENKEPAFKFEFNFSPSEDSLNGIAKAKKNKKKKKVEKSEQQIAAIMEVKCTESELFMEGQDSSLDCTNVAVTEGTNQKIKKKKKKKKNDNAIEASNVDTTTISSTVHPVETKNETSKSEGALDETNSGHVNNNKKKKKKKSKSKSKSNSKAKDEPEDDDFDELLEDFKAMVSLDQVNSSLKDNISTVNEVISDSQRDRSIPHFLSPNDPELSEDARRRAKYGNGKNLVAIGPKKKKDASWLESNQFATKESSNIEMVENQDRCHSSPFTFSFSGIL